MKTIENSCGRGRQNERGGENILTTEDLKKIREIVSEECRKAIDDILRTFRDVMLDKLKEIEKAK